MFHRRAARHAAGKGAAPGRPISLTPLAPGFMMQRPYAHVVLGAPRYRVHDLVEITGSDAYPTHIGRTGKISAITHKGTVLPITVDFEGGGAAFFESTDLQLVRNAPTMVLPVVQDEPVVTPVTVVQVSGAAIGYWAPAGAVGAPTAAMDAVDGDEPMANWERELLAAEADPSGAELTRFYADIEAEDAAQPSTSLEDRLQYAAECAAAGNPLMQFEREIMGLPLDADDIELMGGAR